MLSCNCLNILIQFEKDDKITKEELNLSEEEKCDRFFQQEVWHVGKLLDIKRLYSRLVNVRHIGLWTICECFNCDIQTHAIHKDKGSSFVLVHPNLLREDAINNIRTSEYFSKIFDIVLNPNTITPDSTSKNNSYFNRDIEKIYKKFNDVVANYINHEEMAVEERIKNYADEQYDNLNKMKSKAFRELDSIINVVNNAIKKTKSQSAYLSSPQILQSGDHELPTSPLDRFVDTNNSPTSAPIESKRPKNTPTQQSEDNQCMVEDLIFDFEVEDIDQTYHSDISEENDDIEQTGDVANNEAAGISIYQGTNNKTKTGMAQSCPVDIPILSSFPRKKSTHMDAWNAASAADDDDDLSPNPEERTVDIAASIKALARSVHGDTIFGELPRPRFSSQI